MSNDSESGRRVRPFSHPVFAPFKDLKQMPSGDKLVVVCAGLDPKEGENWGKIQPGLRIERTGSNFAKLNPTGRRSTSRATPNVFDDDADPLLNSPSSLLFRRAFMKILRISHDYESQLNNHGLSPHLANAYGVRGGL